MAIEASRALFASSPVVVLLDIRGAKSNAATLAREAAVELGVPLLVTGNRSLELELDRLQASAVLSFGADASGWTSTTEGRQVLHGPTEMDQVPEFVPVDKPAPALVLTTGSTKAASKPSTPAALITAEAAGALVKIVEKPDPRASAETIKLLRQHRDRTLLAVGKSFAAAETFRQHVETALTAPQLPGGGQLVFPGRRMVALYGHPGTSALGVLGEQGIQASIQRAKDLAQQYQPYSDEPVIPAFEIITTVATAESGEDGDYSAESSVGEIRPWVEAAQEAGVYVVLDLQPGTTSFLAQANRYRELLEYPNVGLALDPEWRLKPGQRHMLQIGSVDAAEVNAVSDWLAGLTRKNNLPQKVFLLHQFSHAMIGNRAQLNLGHDELATVIHADGHGSPGAKQDTYAALQTGLNEAAWMGWKNFLDEDSPTFTPRRTYTKVEPKPWFVSYQ